MKNLFLKNTLLFICLFLVQGMIAQNKINEKKMNSFISSLMKKMTLDEKIGQLYQCNGGGFITGPNNEQIPKEEYIMKGYIGSMLNVGGVENIHKYQEAAMKSHLKIPLMFGLDVIHGYHVGFPVPLGEAASFDLGLMEETARWAAIETSAEGIHWTFAPMIDVSWDARWGRVVEGAGEDPYYGALVAAARVRGFQGDDLSKNNTILACAKHFAAYGAPIAGKEYNSVDMSLGHFANFYMPPYKAAVEAGVATVMTAFNDFNNIPCTANEFLLRNLLKKEWGFKGIVVSDHSSLQELINHRYAADRKDAAAKGLNAGLDMEMATTCYVDYLKELVNEGEVNENLIDDAVRRILEMKYKLGLFDDPFRYGSMERLKTDINTPACRETALRISERSIVLLKNENNVLPLSKSTKKVALIGALSKSQDDMAGAWSGADRDKIITVYEAMRRRGVEIHYCDGYDLDENKIVDLQQSLEAARESDIVVVAMGERAGYSGERAARVNITIPEEQQKLVSELVKTGKPVVVLLMCGRPVIFNEVRRDAHAILCTWWLGSEAGNAICNVLWGDYNPSGKLPVTFPEYVGQIPLNYQFKSTGRPASLDDYWRSSYNDASTDPVYPFGYGLSYTTFEYSDLKVLPGNGKDIHTRVSVTISNSGSFQGEEVVQLYVQDKVASITRPVKELKGFRKISLKAGESQTIVFDITDEQLGFYDNQIRFVVEKGDFLLMVGTDSQHVQSVEFILK